MTGFHQGRARRQRARNGPIRTRPIWSPPYSAEYLGVDVNQGVIGDSDGGHTDTKGHVKWAVSQIIRLAADRIIAIEDFPPGFRRDEFGFQHALLEEMGERIVHVPAAYTSQRCSFCGHTARENRPSRRKFRCKQCSHIIHADVNAARNIADRAQRAQDYRRGPGLGKGLPPAGR